MTPHAEVKNIPPMCSIPAQYNTDCHLYALNETQAPSAICQYCDTLYANVQVFGSQSRDRTTATIHIRSSQLPCNSCRYTATPLCQYSTLDHQTHRRPSYQVRIFATEDDHDEPLGPIFLVSFGLLAGHANVDNVTNEQ